MMSLKLSLILLCGLFAHAVHANQATLTQLIDEAAAESSYDFLIALKSARKVLESLAQAQMQNKDRNAIIPIWKSIVETWNHEKGSQSIRKISTEVKNIMHDRTASQTMVTVANMLHECFTYEPPKKNLRFPWKDFRNLIYSDNIHVFPLLYSGIWEIALNGKTSEKFSKVVNFFGDALVTFENKHDMSNVLNDEKIKDRMDTILGPGSGEGNSLGEPALEIEARHIYGKVGGGSIVAREIADSETKDVDSAKLMHQNGGGDMTENVGTKSMGV